MPATKSPVKLEVSSIEEFFANHIRLPRAHIGDVIVSVNISDRMREAYYDFVSLALQLSDYGFEPLGIFPNLITHGEDYLFGNRFADDDGKRVYIQRGVKDSQSYCNIGIRNYRWPGNPIFIETPDDMKKGIKPITYCPNTLSDILS